MLVPGNSKLGRAIFSFSIPAVHTCPGKTAACEAVCYAKRGFFTMATTRGTHNHNWQQTRRSNFVAEVVAEVRAKQAKIVRIHAAGDFYSAKYTRLWYRIAKRCPDTRFYAYSRSWRVPRIRRALKSLSTLPNFRLWLSTDHASGLAPRWKNTRIAYMLLDGETVVPPQAHLVFRVARRGAKHGPLKFVDNRLICPAEQNVSRQVHLGCSECRLCFNDRDIPQKPLLQIGA